MKKLHWCLKKAGGIRLIPPSEDVCKEYVKSSESNLATMLRLSGKWRTITAYYACYDCLYAILQKIGIKSEIHDCSIEMMNLIVGFSDSDRDFLAGLKMDRIDVQYHLKQPKDVDTQRVREFILTCKIIIASIAEDQIKGIRARVVNVNPI